MNFFLITQRMWRPLLYQQKIVSLAKHFCNAKIVELGKNFPPTEIFWLNYGTVEKNRLLLISRQTLYLLIVKEEDLALIVILTVLSVSIALLIVLSALIVHLIVLSALALILKICVALQ